MIMTDLAIHYEIIPLRVDSAITLFTLALLEYSVAPIKRGNLQDPKKTPPLRRAGRGSVL